MYNIIEKAEILKIIVIC